MKKLKTILFSLWALFIAVSLTWCKNTTNNENGWSNYKWELTIKWVWPEIVNSLESIDDYEVIYVWGPIYRWQLPQPMVTQLEKLNWEWKIVRPFTTHEGSGLAGVPSQLKNLCKWAEVLEWLAIRGISVYQEK